MTNPQTTEEETLNSQPTAKRAASLDQFVVPQTTNPYAQTRYAGEPSLEQLVRDAEHASEERIPECSPNLREQMGTTREHMGNYRFWK